jgi:hypothetical protein
MAEKITLTPEALEFFKACGRKGGMSKSDKKIAAVSKNMKKAHRISRALARQKKKA